MTGPLISFLTDFGLRDPSAAIMHGVVLGIAPDARLVDISHEVRKFSIRDGALLLWCALPYLPVGYHVAVVDPGVGTAPIGSGPSTSAMSFPITFPAVSSNGSRSSGRWRCSRTSCFSTRSPAPSIQSSSRRSST
ncbi:MAG: hypothetical protein NVS9B8_03580 [Candidatus Limnocylindrales bacterium]